MEHPLGHRKGVPSSARPRIVVEGQPFPTCAPRPALPGQNTMLEHDPAATELAASQSKPPYAIIMEMATAYWAAQAVCTAAILGIADRLAQGPMDAAAIAEAVGAHPGATYRLLRALASVG